MNFTALQERVKERCGLSSTDAGIGASETGALAHLVNAAMHKIETSYPPGWDWLRYTGQFSTITDQEAYSFEFIASLTGGSLAIAKVVEVRFGLFDSTGRYPLERRSRREADDMYPFTSGTTPELYWVEGRELGLRPVPGGVYQITITAIRQESDLANPTDTPLMPAMFHDAIVETAAELWFRRVHNLNDAQVCQAAAKEWQTRMLSYQRPYVGPGMVRGYSEVWG